MDWERRRKAAESILDTAGLTPLVRIRRVIGDIPAAVYAKLEYYGPSGSLKDRILPFMIAEAERRGELRPGMTLIEGTTGNTGIATAMVGAAKGDRKSTRLNSSHLVISYAVFCLKKKNHAHPAEWTYRDNV